MTLKQAVVVLNRYRFLWCSDWHVEGNDAVGNNFLEILPAFLAIGIALAYNAGYVPAPRQPVIEGVTLLPAYRHPDVRVPFEADQMLTYAVQITPDPTVATYTITYTTTPTGSTTPGPATTVPLASGITCNALDTVSVTAIAVGTDGVSSVPSAAFTFTAASGPLVPPPAAPAAPVITGVTQLT